MTLYFSVVMIISVVLFTLVRWVLKNNHKKHAGFFFNAYALIICGLLGWQIGSYIGLGKYETPRLPSHCQRGIAYMGCYVAPDSEFLFTSRGKKKKNGFGIHLLHADEKIILKPVYKNRQANHWHIRHNTLTYPMRINNRCINITGNARLTKPEDTFFICLKKERAIHIAALKYRQDVFYLSYVIQSPSRKLDYKLQNEVISRISLREGIKLSALFLVSPNSHIKNNMKSIPLELKQTFEKILLVREIKDKCISPIGVLLEKSLLTTPGLSFFINKKPLTRIDEERKWLVRIKCQVNNLLSKVLNIFPVYSKINTIQVDRRLPGVL
jgi:hypothetical protein